MTSHTLDIPTIETKRLRIELLSMRHSKGMFEMWRHAAVQEFSGRAEDEHRNEITMPAQTDNDSDRLLDSGSKQHWKVGAFVGQFC